MGIGRPLLVEGDAITASDGERPLQRGVIASGADENVELDLLAINELDTLLGDALDARGLVDDL